MWCCPGSVLCGIFDTNMKRSIVIENTFSKERVHENTIIPNPVYPNILSNIVDVDVSESMILVICLSNRNTPTRRSLIERFSSNTSKGLSFLKPVFLKMCNSIKNKNKKGQHKRDITLGIRCHFYFLTIYHGLLSKFVSSEIENNYNVVRSLSRYATVVTVPPNFPRISSKRY